MKTEVLGDEISADDMEFVGEDEEVSDEYAVADLNHWEVKVPTDVLSAIEADDYTFWDVVEDKGLICTNCRSLCHLTNFTITEPAKFSGITVECEKCYAEYEYENPQYGDNK